MQRILVCVSGGIAAYKSAELVREFVKQGYEVQCVMTASAQQFLGAMTLQALTKKPVFTDILDPRLESAMGHIELAKWADKVVVAPATANTIAKMAHGLADDIISCLYLATEAPVWLAPAMNKVMWQHPAVQANVAMLRERQVRVLGPQSGEQACGDVGLGRMMEPLEIAQHVLAGQKGDAC